MISYAASDLDFFPSPTIRHAEVDRLRIILDLRTETYRILDDAASVFWSILVGEADAAASFQGLTECYIVDDERLQADFAAFAERCVEEGLLQRAGAPPASGPSAAPTRLARRTRPRTMKAFICLLATKLALARHGFGATYHRYALLPIGTKSVALNSVLSAFTRAENFFVARRAPQDCLLRSLALFRFLRSANIPAEHVIGVRRFPFNAHAWVEYNGSPLLDDHCHGFTPLARIDNGQSSRATVQ